jgi:intracellular sulfur oxidation DsrE/DsrF family protein
MKKPDKLRRHMLRLAGLFGAGVAAKAVHAHHTETHFEDSSPHKLVYQCNNADHEYLDHILFSCGEMLRKYGDDIELVVAAFGPGIHLLGKRPGRGVSRRQQERASSLSDYGVAFHACGNTMQSLGWTEDDLLDFARVVPIGVDDIMLLQEKGFAYMSW